MRVLQAMAGDVHGGAETYFTDLVVALQEAGLDQVVVTRDQPERLLRLRAAGVPTRVASFKNVFAPLERRRLRRLVKEVEPDIVQTWMGRASRLTPKGTAIKVGWFGGYYDLKRFSDCDWYVGVTHDIAQHIVRSGAPKERVRTIHTLSDVSDDAPVDRSAFDTPQDAPLVLALARLHQKKGLDTLLQTISGLPGAYLWIAGEGPMRGELERLSAQLDLGRRVRFLGWRTDRIALLRAADVCAFPSRYEPFGTVMVEAWAAGTPLVTTAAAGPKAYVTPGEDALLVEIDDVAGLREALMRVLEDAELRARLVAGGRRTFEARFTRERIVETYLDFYRSVIEAGKTAK